MLVWSLSILLATSAVFSTPAHAICLKNCTQPAQNQDGQIKAGSIGYMTDQPGYRERSPNTGDVKNSVMGDVNIRIGHERLEIMMDGGASSNTVDASINSTVILGDMKK